MITWREVNVVVVHQNWQLPRAKISACAATLYR